MFRITEDNYTLQERIESLRSHLDHLSHFKDRYTEYDRRMNVVAMLENQLGKEWFLGRNIVTIDGNSFYASQGTGVTYSNNYLSANNRCELQNPASPDTPANTDNYGQVSNPITASRKALTASYPQVSDPDTDNTGSGITVVSWDYSWLTTDFNTNAANNITGGCIHNAAGSPVSGTKLLTHFNFSSSFAKSDTDKLKVFVNHTLVGI